MNKWNSDKKENYYLDDYAVKVILSRIFIYNKIFLEKYFENIQYLMLKLIENI